MLDQTTTSIIAVISIALAIASFLWQVYSSRQDDKHQTNQTITQTHQAEALDRQAEALERQANVLEARAGGGADTPEETQSAEDSPFQRWARAYVRDRIASTRNVLRNDIREAIAPVSKDISELKAHVDSLVTAPQYMDHEANLYRTVDEAKQVRAEAEQVRDQIREYQRQGLNTSDIQRQILRNIGSELLRMADPTLADLSLPLAKSDPDSV